MSHKISIPPHNIEFTVNENDNILNAALAANINLPHSCKNGDCGSCICKITQGSVELLTYNKTVLSDESIANGYTLTCRAVPKSDIVLDIPGFNNSFPIKTLPAKIESLNKVGTVAIIKLKLPANQIFAFEAGQYIDILHEGKTRSYSIANSPTQTSSIELHIRYHKDGFLSEAIWHRFQINQILRIKGPMGNFKLQNTSNPILMVCTGTGFAPIKAILEQMIDNGNSRQITLVWGNYTPEDFYMTEILSIWQNKLNITIKLCVDSGVRPNFYCGLVTSYIKENFTSLSAYEIYACGNSAMIESLYKLSVINLDLPKEKFYSDVFTPAH